MIMCEFLSLPPLPHAALVRASGFDDRSSAHNLAEEGIIIVQLLNVSFNALPYEIVVTGLETKFPWYIKFTKSTRYFNGHIANGTNIP